MNIWFSENCTERIVFLDLAKSNKIGNVFTVSQLISHSKRNSVSIPNQSENGK